MSARDAVDGSSAGIATADFGTSRKSSRFPEYDSFVPDSGPSDPLSLLLITIQA